MITLIIGNKGSGKTKRLIQLAQFYQVSTDYLLGLTE